MQSLQSPENAVIYCLVLTIGFRCSFIYGDHARNFRARSVSTGLNGARLCSVRCSPGCVTT